jgi:hypothetical protein
MFLIRCNSSVSEIASRAAIKTSVKPKRYGTSKSVTCHRIQPSFPYPQSIKMAPSVAELKTETAPIVVPVKSVPVKSVPVETVPVEETAAVKAPIPATVESVNEPLEEKPKVRRAIDEEGGTTTASVWDRISICIVTANTLPVPTLPSNVGSWTEVSTN